MRYVARTAWCDPAQARGSRGKGHRGAGHGRPGDFSPGGQAVHVARELQRPSFGTADHDAAVRAHRALGRRRVDRFVDRFEGDRAALLSRPQGAPHLGRWATT
jgi:hypothetical protein